jgi:hypothetical protein
MPSAVSSGNGLSAFSGLFGAASVMAGIPYIDRVEHACRSTWPTRSLQETTWKRDAVGSRPATAIAELKQQPGKDLTKYDT